MISLPLERNSYWAVPNDGSIPFVWGFCDKRSLIGAIRFKVFSPSAFLDLQLSLPFPCVVFSCKMKVLWYQNISQDYRDYIKTFCRKQVWQESWPDCRVSSQPFQQQHCQASELPHGSSQIFRLFWSYEPFLCETPCCQFHTPRLPSLSVPAAGWADISPRDLHLVLPYRRVADTVPANTSPYSVSSKQ